ncbi:MAG: cyclase family protein [Holophaga sp.]|nr:cyclase family protein [Holophaga sp.]
MDVLDLTQTIQPAMPVYPGTEPPVIRQANTIAQDGFAEKWIGMYSHTGTHMDAPGHLLPGAATLDQMEVGRFIGKGCVLDASAMIAEIPVSFLVDLLPAMEGCEFVLFHTGWSRRWGQESYYSGFPVLARDAARWLCRRNLKGVGFDAISADPVGAPFHNHLELLGAGLVLIENLTGLEQLAGRPFRFACLPLKLDQADGSPVRAVAMLD